MKWAVYAYNEWREHRIANPETFNIKIFEANLKNVRNLEKQNFVFALCKFISEVVKVKDRSDCPGKTLYEMVISLQKFVNQNGLGWELIEGEDFVEVKNILDNVMKQRAEANLGTVKRQAHFISMDYENHSGKKAFWVKIMLKNCKTQSYSC